MTTRLTKIVEAHVAASAIREVLESRAEWLYVRDGRDGVSVRRGELDFRVAHNRLLFYCLSDEGAEAWRISGWMWTGEKLLFEALRRAGAERAQLQLIPRISASALAAEVSAARRARCALLAQLARARLPGATIERASLSAGAGFNQPGAFARIRLKHRQALIAVTGIMSKGQGPRLDALLSSTLIWFARLNERSRTPRSLKLWIAVRKPSIEPLRQRVALLRPDLRHAIILYELDEGWNFLTPVTQYELEELFETRPPRINVSRAGPSATAYSIMSLAPDAIDIVRARHGETLRFRGLSFARVRRTMNLERVWFGLDSSNRKMLDDHSKEEFERLLSELAEHRRADATALHHALYKQSAEAWLESILRRDITRLDPGLRLAPLHSQFRVHQPGSGGARPVDLLAIRHDGRLVVIELKVSEDREHVMQGADYWRRVEAYRRHGAISRARLFDAATISDEPPLVYLAAPALSFHRAFNRLAQSLRSEIELYRFDLNEDWRAGVRVIRRCQINQ
jgi:hypothetical protein